MNRTQLIVLILGVLLLLWPEDSVKIEKHFDELEAKAISSLFVYVHTADEDEEAPPVPKPNPGELGGEPTFVEELPEVVRDEPHKVEQNVQLNTLPADVNVYVWSAKWCPACQTYVPQVARYFNTKDETRVYKVDYDKSTAVAAQYNITKLPTVQIVSSELDEKGQPVKVWTTLNNHLLPNKETIVALANQSRYAANNFLENKTVDVPRYVYKMEWGGWIDLDNYSKNCNCNMCQNIRYLQERRSFQTYNDSDLPDHQEPSTDKVMISGIHALYLNSDDILGSLGCGDARELIFAVQEYDCKAVGIEIDPIRYQEAKRQVALAGLSDKITIYQGDVRDFDLSAYGITAVYAYLYENLLEELSEEIGSVNKAVTPYHRIKSLPATPKGQLWLYGSLAKREVVQL